MMFPCSEAYWELCMHVLSAWLTLGSVIAMRIQSQLSPTHMMILSHHLRLTVLWFCDRGGVFQEDNATIHKGTLVAL